MVECSILCLFIGKRKTISLTFLQNLFNLDLFLLFPCCFFVKTVCCFYLFNDIIIFVKR